MSASLFAQPQPVAPEQRQALYQQAETFDTELSRNTKGIRIGGYVVGGVGMAMGLCGMVMAASLFPLKQTRVEFIPVNTETGLAGTSVLAKDAPEKLFGEQQAHADLTKFVTAVETWVADASDLNFHQTSIMSSKDQQAAFLVRMDKRSPSSPAVLYSNKATVRVENFKYSMMGKGVNGVQIWQVRYDRTVISGGNAEPKRPWNSTVTFAWHPEVLGTDQDRALNLTGFQCIAYESGPV